MKIDPAEQAARARRWIQSAVRKIERRPTVIGVAPPPEGTPRPSPKGEIGRYSVVRGKRVR